MNGNHGEKTRDQPAARQVALERASARRVAPERTPAWRGRPALVGAALVCAALLVGLWHAAAAGSASSPTASAPHLIVHGHAQILTASLEGGIRLRGTLYPALPGRNTLRVTVSGGRTADLRGPVELSITMPGMAMRPLRATLSVQAGHYGGTIVLPMFGAYLADVLLAAPRGHRRGTLRFAVPLNLPH